ncbi:MAG: hypothetical protein KGK03_09785 [Candidatus Omnitrophica bacterium]|nr:hypothetical protein [Candidatus Omnitrophota bacterium]MDE2223343.1 hypothetical protein [Candidatus Omnitrophota bacterium]
MFQGLLSADSLSKVKLLKSEHAFVCEGRPSLEAGRTTTAIFLKKGITPIVISDNMPGFLFYKGLVKRVFLACQYEDQGGALCDTGALILAVLAQKHKVPVTLLQAVRRHRFLGDPHMVASFEGKRMAPKGTRGYVPLVEWVPVRYLGK